MFKLAPAIASLLVSISLSATESSFNFQNVELFSFTCDSVSQDKDITGAEWNRDEAILRVFKVEETLEFEVTKSFIGKSLTMLGESIDGSEEKIQFILRKDKKSSVVINSKGQTKLDCQLELI